ncbi:hypothetical protein, partial [Acidisphaera sp. S103]|uniref:hypothetical protein n=1 Tax=Acidisphaera sp. S103 TaxID=1747223 RepID=UPI00131EA679
QSELRIIGADANAKLVRAHDLHQPVGTSADAGVLCGGAGLIEQTGERRVRWLDGGGQRRKRLTEDKNADQQTK